MALPAPASEQAVHVEAVVPAAKEAPRVTEARIKVATEIRRLEAPPEVVSDKSDRGRQTMLVRRGVAEDGFAVAPAQEVAAQDRSRRAGILIAVGAVLVVGGAVGLVATMGGDPQLPVTTTSVQAAAPQQVAAPTMTAEEPKTAPSEIASAEPAPPEVAPQASASSASAAPAAKAQPAKSAKVTPSPGPPAKGSSAAPPPSSAKPAASSDFNGIRF